MPIGKIYLTLDYSKWDAIELSDDEDFECHPNVDKKSMVRWKQAQVHKQRRERKDQRDLLQMEYNLTEEYLKFIPEEIKPLATLTPTQIFEYLKNLSERVEKKFTDPIRTESLGRMKDWPGNWEPPVWGDVLRSHKPWHEEINNIGKELVEFIAKEQDGQHIVKFLFDCFQKHIEMFKERQIVVKKQIKDFEDEMSKKLTSDNLVTGFDKTFVSKEKTDESSVAPAADKHKPSGKEKIQEATLEEFEATDEHIRAIHPQLLEISKKTDYGDIARIIKQYPVIQTEKNEEILLLRGLALQIIGRTKDAKTAVTVSMIIKYTRSLGPSGVDMFFTKLSGTGTSAQNLFFSDLDKTYQHITARGAVLRKEKLELQKKLEEQQETRKKLIESFTQPDGSLKIPLGENPTEMEKKQAEWFDNLPHDYKVGLLNEDVDKINAYLSSLPPEEADLQAKLAAKAGFIQLQEDDDEKADDLD
ncbi:hsp90 co-chaperone Cdc37 [Boothiomyces sp. JEL0866]|nr:hsp90 co-chaperone Cdc37 [Boothiomyces sp. JEL0866]